MLDDLALFVAIVDDGSLQAAARRLDLPAATLTRRLQKLEARLGCQLLLRSARSLKPTPEGQLYYEQCRRSEEQTSELQSLMRISYAVFCLTNKKTQK